MIRRGIQNPLLLVRKGLLILGIASVLSACSSKPPLPEFSASGFIADDGVIRLWRLNNPQSQPQVLMVVYSPYKSTDTSITFLEYRNAQLWQIRSQVFDAHNPNMSDQLRFNKNDDVIFMQREVAGKKMPLTQDDIVRWRFEAKRILDVSTALITGDIQLYQGYWQQGKVTTCSGEIRNITFEPYAENWLKTRMGERAQKLTIAWLESPEGTQLLMVANDDFCKWEPTKKSW
nr:DUF1481 domain-containing protein [uncultured Moellerella sp.]